MRLDGSKIPRREAGQALGATVLSLVDKMMTRKLFKSSILL